MPNVKCIRQDALYIGVFLGTSIFGHVENAFLKIFFVSCYSIEPLICLGSWIVRLDLGFTMQNFRRKYLQRNFW